MAKKIDDNIEDLLSRCRALDWEVTEMSTGYRIKNKMGGATTLPKSGNGRRVDNALSSLRGIGLEEAEAQVAQLRTLQAELEAAKRTPSSAPPAVFTPPMPTQPPAASPPAAAKTADTPGGVISITVMADEMYTVSERITPEMAEEMLARPLPMLPSGKRILQRTLDEAHVLWLAGQMDRGEWVEKSPHGVCLGPAEVIDAEVRDGGVLDGQHRLKAVALVGRPVIMRVTRNVPAEAFYSIDSGKKRSQANMLSTIGETNTFQLASALKSLWCWDNWRQSPTSAFANWENWHRQRISQPQTEQILEKYPQVRDEIKNGANLLRQIGGINAAGAVFLTVTRRAIDTIDNPSEAAHWHRKLDEFSEQVRTGEMLRQTDPAMAVRRWLLNGGGPGGGDRRDRQLLGLLKAWNAQASGRDLKIIKIVQGEAMVVPYVPRVPASTAKAA